MVVLGRDPDLITDEWYDWDEVYNQAPGQRSFIRSPKVREAVKYFAYHPKMKMSQRFNDEDQDILCTWIARQLRSGYTEEQIKRAIDRFYVSWAGEYDVPVYGITSSKIHERLFEGERTHHGDDILDWLVDGMGDTGPFDDPRGVRSMLLLRSHEGSLRYPEVVVSILRYAGSLTAKERLLNALEYIIAWNLYDEHDRAKLYASQQMIKPYNPPAELLTGIHGAMRPASATMSKAIARHEGRRGKRTD